MKARGFLSNKGTDNFSGCIITVNGKLTVKGSHEGWLSFYNQHGKLLLAEYWRNRNRIDRLRIKKEKIQITEEKK